MRAAAPRTIGRIAWVAGALTFVAHLVANPHYGFFRDELYFIICGFHPAWGYVDQPPLVPLSAAATQLFGHSLVLLRAIPALLAGAAVVAACALAVELGGGAFAQTVTAIVVALSPVLLSFGMKVSTDEANPLLWTLAALGALRVVHGRDPRWWLLAGGSLGIALETKYSAAFFAVALVLALLLTPERRAMRTRWFAIAIGLCVILALPSVVWQWSEGLPMLELLRAGQNGKNVIVGPAVYLLQEVLITGALFALVWIAGLVRLAADRSARFLALAWALLIAMMIALHGKHYYPAAVYPIPFAAGCVALEAWTRRVRLLRPAVAVVLAASGLSLAPLVLPVLPERDAVAYELRVMHAGHVPEEALQTEHGRTATLDPDFADMHGWPRLAATVERAVATLPPNDRARAVIVASNYGEASALDFFGRGLPPVISGHNEYYLWGTHGRSGDVLIDVNGDCGAGSGVFAHARRLATFDDPWAIAWERHIPIMLCEGIRTPLAVLWPRKREFR
ncbi:MAG TPA: glycosyltransferase family 39 protein [Candidatus Baltobacteraceae bacterium]|nr:glycosyltransferase family 39 protein [Candidatus Baltobacteraceae bacterium]